MGILDNSTVTNREAVITAISESRRPYMVYSALLTQSGTGTPVVTILENTIGNIEWARVDVGYYTATLTDSFPLDKTTVSIAPDSAAYTKMGAYIPNNDSVEFYSWDISTLPITTGADSIFFRTFIEIRVYN